MIERRWKRVQRVICHPFLLTEIGHREAYAVQCRVSVNKCPETFGLEILFRFYFNGNNGILLLHDEIHFACRIFGRPIIGAQFPCYQLSKHI